uniref:Kringle domain-containing protein n=1 Tax=Branchiostoma floridae TaxID=7739 RepID=C3YDM1_BRAFL|eukprot:XP_002605480.1 hypothetical protein BRAFLDRAFT_92897 [Branchiostoma floridae]
MGDKNRVQTTLLLVVHLLLLGRECSALTVQQAAELKTQLEVVKAKCDGARIQVAQTSLTLNAGASEGLHPPAPTGAPNVNIAQGQLAFQTSSYAWYSGADRAVDGNTNGQWSARSCTHTHGQANPAWWVDLGHPHIVNRVVIYNRWDCCRERLNPFNIHIGDSAEVAANPKCGGDHRIGLSERFTSVLCQGMTGRYVGVRLPGSSSRILSMAEVQVFSNEEFCQAGNGASYRGTATRTRSGRTCQRWDSQTPHGHDRTPRNYPAGGLVNNYCRNPDGWYALWCYTTDRNSRWEYCDVPSC